MAFAGLFFQNYNAATQIPRDALQCVCQGSTARSVTILMQKHKTEKTKKNNKVTQQEMCLPVTGEWGWGRAAFRDSMQHDDRDVARWWIHYASTLIGSAVTLSGPDHILETHLWVFGAHCGNQYKQSLNNYYFFLLLVCLILKLRMG